MARVRLWTLSPAERSILIIYSSELPHSWLRETTASSGPEIPHPRSHQPGPQRPGAWLCPAQLGNRGLNKSWKSIWFPSWRHRPVSQQGSVSCSVSFQASSVPSAHPAPWGCMVEARTQLRQVRSPGFPCRKTAAPPSSGLWEDSMGKPTAAPSRKTEPSRIYYWPHWKI